MTVKAKTTRPNNKACKKLLPLDVETVGRLNRASHLLGIPATAFIRLALHRAFEQVLDIITQVVDASAQEYVEGKARGFYKVKSKKGVPKHALSDPAALAKLIRRVSPINVPRREALNAVARALRVRQPRSWGTLKFIGSAYEQRVAESVLAGQGETARLERQLRESMADVFTERVTHQAKRWRALPQLQAKVAGAVRGLPEGLEASYAKDLPQLRAGLESVKKGTPLPAGFMDLLKEKCANLHHHWERMTNSDRMKLLKQRIELFSSRQLLLSAHQKQVGRELDRLKEQPEFWLNPWALERWLESNQAPNTILP